MAVAYCDEDELPDFINQECPVSETGRIIGVALVKDGVTLTNWSDPVEWQAEIDLGNIKIIKFTKGGYPGGDETTVEGYGRQKERTTGQTHTSNISVLGVKDNYEFFNVLRVSTIWKPVFMTAGDTVHVVEVPANYKPKQVIPEELDAEQNYSFDVVWTDINDPDVFDAPTGIFE